MDFHLVILSLCSNIICSCQSVSIGNLINYPFASRYDLTACSVLGHINTYLCKTHRQFFDGYNIVNQVECMFGTH